MGYKNDNMTYNTAKDTLLEMQDREFNGTNAITMDGYYNTNKFLFSISFPFKLVSKSKQCFAFLQVYTLEQYCGTWNATKGNNVKQIKEAISLCTLCTVTSVFNNIIIAKQVWNVLKYIWKTIKTKPYSATQKVQEEEGQLKEKSGMKWMHFSLKEKEY